MTQPRLDFTVPVRPLIRVRGPRAAGPRLSAQCRRILARLEQGPATNRELAGIALKYTGRLSELRQAGYRIVAFGHDHSTGVCWYRLEG